MPGLLGWGQSSRKMLEPGMCPAEMSLTPFVTRNLRLLCFSVTHRGRGKDSPLHFFLCYLLHQETSPIPSPGLPPALLRETFVSEGPLSHLADQPPGALIHLHSQNARISFGAIQPPLLLVDEIRWNR
uniref:Uncharacterized protein n=1 Tax=Aotus nancymaae TaxID=37293 RepID=A0A2K5CEL5_AOTNA